MITVVAVQYRNGTSTSTAFEEFKEETVGDEVWLVGTVQVDQGIEHVRLLVDPKSIALQTSKELTIEEETLMRQQQALRSAQLAGTSPTGGNQPINVPKK